MKTKDISSLSTEELEAYAVDLKYEIKRLDMQQQTRKIQINSAYGCLCNAYYRWYDVRIGEAVTLTGQYIIRTIINSINESLNKVCGSKDYRFVISAATDSVYVKTGPLIDKFFKGDKSDVNAVIDFVDIICSEVIQPIIMKTTNNISKTLNFYSNEIKMKRETISRKGIWVGINRYCLDVYVSEAGKYSEPEILVKGIEAVRSSTPQICKSSLKEGIKVLLRGTEEEFQKHISEFKERFYSSEISEISMTSSANNLEKYSNKVKSDSEKPYLPSTPVTTKAALIYNHFLKKNNLHIKYEEIKEADKIKYVYLKKPNRVNDNIIGYLNKLPEELLPINVDFERQFGSVYLSILDRISKCVGWNVEHRPNLDEFF